MKKVIEYIFILFVTLLSFSSCSGLTGKNGEGAHSRAEGLRKTVMVGKLAFTIQYKPTNDIIKMEHITDPDLAARRKTELDSMVWFNVSFHIDSFGQSPLLFGIRDRQVYQERLDYYLNYAQRDFELVCGKDTLYPSAYWFENSQNLMPQETMVVGFKLLNGKIPDNDLHLSYYDRVFRTGIIKTIIREKDIKNALINNIKKQN